MAFTLDQTIPNEGFELEPIRPITTDLKREFPSKAAYVLGYAPLREQQRVAELQKALLDFGVRPLIPHSVQVYKKRTEYEAESIRHVAMHFCFAVGVFSAIAFAIAFVLLATGVMKLQIVLAITMCIAIPTLGFALTTRDNVVNTYERIALETYRGNVPEKVLTLAMGLQGRCAEKNEKLNFFVHESTLTSRHPSMKRILALEYGADTYFLAAWDASEMG